MVSGAGEDWDRGRLASAPGSDTLSVAQVPLVQTHCQWPRSPWFRHTVSGPDLPGSDSLSVA